MPPLGFDTAPEGGRLVVNKDEAIQVRRIFDLYVEHTSLIRVVEALNHRDWRRKSWTTKTGKAHQGKEWDKKSLRQLLTNALYIGQQRLGKETFAGDHDAIVSKALFKKVQRALGQNHRDGVRSGMHGRSIISPGSAH